MVMVRTTQPPQRGSHSLWSSIGYGVLFLASRLRSQQSIEGAPPPQLLQHVDAEPVNVLCMDGGGIKGRNLMVVVEEMERLSGSPVASSFHLTGGSSIGGCGSLFISHFGQNATGVSRRAMHDLQSRCFADQSKMRLLRAGHMCADERAAFVVDVCGD